MGPFETIRYAVRDGLARITLARPDKRNAMNATMFDELGTAAEAAAADPDVRGLLLHADGPAFSAGLDLSILGDLPDVRGPGFRSFVGRAQRPIAVLASMPKPSVAAVEGPAIGAGLQLCLACDLRVAGPGARFAVMELRFGLIPDLGGMHRLARLIGAARTKELVWTSRFVEAQEAERVGLVNQLADDPVSGAETLLAEIMAHSPTALRLSKAAVDRAFETPFDEEMEREADEQAEAIRSEDHLEAVAAFLERRPPSFRQA